jgi:glycosyltransferase involved in cell wall biosynthesis
LGAGDLKVGVDTGFFRGPATGVVNYTLNLMKSSLHLEPELRYIGLTGHVWHNTGCDDFGPISAKEANADDEGPAGRYVQTRLARLRKAAARISVLRSARSSARKIRTALSSASKASFDLFHAFNFLPPFDPGAPVLPVVYDLSTFRYPEFHPADRVKWLAGLEACIKRAPVVQTISEFSKREIVDVFDYPAERIFVASPAASPIFAPRGEAGTSRNLAPFGLKTGQYFLSVGTLEPRKNYRTLIAAYAELAPAARAQCPLVIVGEKGWGNLNLPRQADSLRADGSLRFLEGVRNLKLSSLYEGARLVLMPSLYEGFGMPIVEALACGTPVAFSANSSMIEIAADLSRTASAQDVDAWNSILKEALASHDHLNEELRELRIRRARTFDWDRSAGLVLDAYRDLNSISR